MSQIVSVEELIAAQQAVRHIYVAEEVKRYIVELVTATRNHPDVYLGSSPRGSLALFRTSQTRAAMAGRDYVIPDDVKALAEGHTGPSCDCRPRSPRESCLLSDHYPGRLISTPVPGATVR
jgi:MoxR-like ATPase